MSRTRTLGAYLDTRLLEWALSSFLVLTGTSMLVWMRMIHGSILQVVIDVFGETAVALGFITIGLGGLAALIANGSSLWVGPWIRALSAALRAIIWSTFVLSMAKVSLVQGFPSPMVILFGIFTIVEVYISYRAVLDVRAY